MMVLASLYPSNTAVERKRQFVDQDRVIRDIKRCLQKHKSCAVIGGAGMGKTSVLMHVKKMFSSTDQSTDLRFIPIYFRPVRVGSTRSMYQQLVEHTIPQIRRWLEKCIADVTQAERALGALDLISPRLMTKSAKQDWSETYTDFEQDLYTILYNAVLPVGSNIKLLFLLDDIFNIEDRNCRKAFVEHWLQLLGTELRFCLAIVITCLEDFFDQFDLHRLDASMGPGIGYQVVEQSYLHVLEQVHSCQVVERRLGDILNRELTNEVANEIHNLIGGHPGLLQDAVDDLRFEAKMGRSIDIACVRSLKPTWQRACREIYRWIQDMIDREDPPISSLVLGLLVTKDEIWEYPSLVEAIRRHPVGSWQAYRLSGILQMLTSWGVVCQFGEDRCVYRVSGGLLLEWLELLLAAHIDEAECIHIHEPSAEQQKEEPTMTDAYTITFALAVMEKAVEFLFGQAAEMLRDWRERRGASDQIQASEPPQIDDESSIDDPQILHSVLKEQITVLEQQAQTAAYRMKVKETEALMRQIENLHQKRLRYEEEATKSLGLDDRVAAQERIEDTDKQIAQRADKMRRILEQLCQCRILIPALDE